MVTPHHKLAYWVGDLSGLAINFQLSPHGLLQASIFLEGKRFGASEETLTADNYLSFTIESMVSPKIKDWFPDIPDPHLSSEKWWEQYDILSEDILDKLHPGGGLDSNPYTDFYDTVVFRCQGYIFLFWRLRTDTEFWADFPSLNEIRNPGHWSFQCQEAIFREKMNFLHRAVMQKVAELRRFLPMRNNE